MFTKFVWFFVLVQPLLASVVKDVVNSCGPTEFACGDGGCVSAELVCDGSRDCADGGDEAKCGTGGISVSALDEVIHRWKRQTSNCRPDQWKCRDGSCISFDGKCDGVVDCRDGSDETHALCRKNVCQHNWFRCTYGACVDGTAPCNNIQECADKSDELLPRCRNESDEIRGQFKCLDGSKIPASSHCDGVKDCPDGSDETVRSCASKTCPSYLFQCAYGACVDSGADCNNIQDCADGSDEAPELCDKNGSAPITPVKPPKGNCVLPQFPEHGTYTTNIPNGVPGEAYDFLAINVTCRQGYGVDGSRSVSCYNGWWPEKMSKCVALCHLPPHPSVEYLCLVNTDGVDGIKNCTEYEPDGTIVSPRCRTPNYYSPTSLRFMHCIGGIWDHIALCSPGLTKNGTNITILVKDSVEVHISDLPYVVPINNSHVPVVPITDNSYNSYVNNQNIQNSHGSNNNLNHNSNIDISHNSDRDKYNGIVETVTPYDNSINIDTGINHNEAKDRDNDSYESLSDIDEVDWRMGVPDNHSTRIPNFVYPKKKTNTNNVNTHNNNVVQNYPSIFDIIKPIIQMKNSDVKTIEESLKSKFTSTTIKPTTYTSTVKTTTENNDEDKGFDIDERFGDSSIEEDNTQSTSTNSPNIKSSTNNMQLYTTRNNKTNVYVNTTKGKVEVKADGGIVLKN